MTVTHLEKIHPLFGVELGDFTIDGPASAEDGQAVLDAVYRYGIVLLRNQFPTEAQMDAFARSLGPVWTLSSSMVDTADYLSQATTAVLRYTNLGSDGKLLPSDDMDPRKINDNWHTDSTYSRPGSTISIFAGRICPPVGANTEFCDTRVAFEGLEPAEQEALRGKQATHSLLHSMRRVGHGEFIRGADRELYSGIERPLVHYHEESGRTSLVIASHIGAISGMSEDESEVLLQKLITQATTPDRVYSHKWSNGDIILWDNRCTMHRATPYDSKNYEREMWIIRIADEAELVPAAA